MPGGCKTRLLLADAYPWTIDVFISRDEARDASTRIALKYIPFIDVVGLEQHVACFRLQHYKRSAGFTAQNVIALAPNHVGAIHVSVRSDQLVDLA